jgi:hypothetical protein
MDLKEIDRQIAELTAAREKALREETEKQAEKHFREAVDLYPKLIEVIRRLDELGYVPPRLAEALKDSSGKLNPGMYIKRPRAPTTRQLQQ